MLARAAKVVGLSFADARDRLPGRVPTVITGNPVRSAILAVPKRRADLAAQAVRELELEPDRRTVVVFGGSQGALHLDQVVADAIRMLEERADLQLLVLTGPGREEVVADAAAASAPLLVRTRGFLDRMELAYAAADLVVARAGATSIAELTVCGLPMLLVPYPHATENHQEANARELERAGAASVILDRDLTPEALARGIVHLIDRTDRLASMAGRASAWARPDAAEALARVVAEAAA
jgi:UDP-N-acetylglucosamine--N-acetylmuramyl-(pentapeptide) pyrophosphoryl-undecaprenol N-acetylglucosamine transferase